MKTLQISLMIFLTFFCVRNNAQDYWEAQASELPEGSSTLDLKFAAIDDNVCWAVNRADNTPGNQFLRTTDGGALWTASTISTAPSSWRGSYISAIDANTAWIVMHEVPPPSGGGVFKTTDGGTTWVRQATAFDSSSGYPKIIHFFDPHDGVCVGDPNDGYWEIYTTSDGGSQWNRVPSANIPQSTSAEVTFFWYSSSGNSLWFSGGDENLSAGRLFRSTNRGLNWEVFPLPDGGVAVPAFKDTGNGIVAHFVPSNKLFKTTNGGETFTEITPFSIPFTTAFISYIPGTTGGYMMTSAYYPGLGSTPGSAYTLDDGYTWKIIDNAVSRGLLSDFASANAGWCGGATDSIYKWKGFPVPIPQDGLQLWLKSDAGVTFGPLDGTVNLWADQSGNGNNAVQSDADRMPLFVDSALNNKPVLRFDGANDRLGLMGTTSMTQLSLFILQKIDAGATGQNSYFPITFGDTAVDGKLYGLIMQWEGLGSDKINVFAGLESWVEATKENCAVFGEWKSISTTTNNNMWNTTLRVNGVDAVVTPAGNNAAMSVILGNSTGTGPGGIGGADNVRLGSTIAKCDIAEVIVYDRVVSDAEILEIEKYLNDKYNVIVGINNKQSVILPKEFILDQNYPNPFNPSTTIRYSIPISGFVTLKVYDVLGKEVAALINKEKPAGSYEVNFNGSNLSSGIYLYTLKTGSYTQTKKLILMK